MFFRTLGVRRDTASYIEGVFLSNIRMQSNFLGNSSIVLAYSKAKTTCNFDLYQSIGDWALWSNSMFSNLEYQDVYKTLGRLSYYSCYSLLRKEWILYEELADDLPRIIERLKRVDVCSLLAPKIPSINTFT